MKKHLITVLLILAFHSGAVMARADEQIRSFAPDSFQKIVTAHAGKPFVVLVWALDCEYCLPSFKALAEAQRQHKLRVVTIATDRADDRQVTGLIRHKLATAGLDSEMWAFGLASSERLRYAIDPKWRGEMPRSYWFDARGHATAYSGIVTAKTVATMLAK